MKTKDGRLIPVEFVSNVYVAGEKDVIQCNIRDITERKRLELAQAEDERRLRDLLQNSADGITLLDADGRVIWESPATTNTQGYYPVQWIGKEVLQLVHPDDVPELRTVLDELARAPSTRATVTFRVRTVSGAWMWMEGILTNKLADPAVRAIVVNYRDITDRKQAQEQLAASGGRTAHPLSAMTDVVIVYDREGRYVSVAPTGTTALVRPPNELLGRRVHEIFPPEQADFFVDKINTVLELGTADQFEYGLQIQGQELWFAAGAAPLSRDTVIWVAHDITRRRSSERAMSQQLGQLQALHAIDQAIAGSTSVHVVLSVILGQVLSRLSADAADVLMYNADLLLLEYASGAGFRTEALQNTRLSIGQGYAGQAALDRQLVSIADLRNQVTEALRSPAFAPEGLLSQEGFGAYFAVPLIAKGRLTGVLEVFKRAPFEAPPEWLTFLRTLAQEAAIAIDNTALFEELQRTNTQLSMAYDATIEGWSKALDLRDKETEGHTQRVTEIALALARRMGLAEAELHDLRRGALLHDIGKMGVPDSILHKPGPLTEEEWALMKRHPALAQEMLAPVQYLERGAGRAALPPRVVGRHGLPTRPQGGADPVAGPHLCRRGRIRRAHFGAPVSPGLDGA